MGYTLGYDRRDIFIRAHQSRGEERKGLFGVQLSPWPEELKRYMNRLGKILPRRATHFCSRHQRQLAREVKRARKMALLPYTEER